MVRGLALIDFGLGGSTPCGVNARAGGTVTLPTLLTHGHQPCFHFLELLILPTGWWNVLELSFQQRACSSWFLAPAATCHIMEAVLMPTHAMLRFIMAAVTQEL